MLRNYIKIAFRNLLRHKAFSLINIGGLAIGMACSILILLWVQDELSFDRFHEHGERTYRLTASLSEIDVHAAVSSAPIAPALIDKMPEIEKIVRISGHRSDLIQVEDRMFEEKRILYADSNFLQFFTFPMLEGDVETALLHPEGIVLTEAMAKKYFGDEKALGKIIRKNHKEDFTVTGVVADIPSNSHLQFDFLQPMSFMARFDRDLKENIWDNFNFFTYIQMNKNFETSDAALKKMEQTVQDIYRANEPNLKVSFHLQRLTDIHLKSRLMADFGGHGDIQYVYIFIVISAFILTVACINFMNLATARSARRAKEVGLRKVAGAARFQLVRQFLAESSVVAFIALLLSLIIVIATLPYFNDLAGKTLSIDLTNIKMIGALVAITTITGLLAGSYPALYLSGFIPVKVLKGNLKSGAASSAFRNTMVIVQFAVSIILLVGTAVIYSQLNFIQTRNLGFDKENLIYTRMTGDLWGKYQTLRSSLEAEPLTKNFSFVSELPTHVSNATIGVEWDGKDPNSQPMFVNIAIDENFIDLFKVTLLEGRTFSKDFRADTSNYLVNEKALAIIGLKPSEVIGKPLTLWGNKGTIIGVVKDFNFKPIQQPIEPLILRLNTWGEIAVVRTSPGQVEATTKALERICKELNPSYPFSYNFVDQDLANSYKAEQRLGTLFTIFASLAIFISCLGLYGLSAFLAERRTKEIGVRKVLGATEFHLVYLLSKTFTKPVLIAMVVAAPIAWFAMNKWLEGFAYHVDIHWSVFALAFIISLVIAWLTVSYESIRAAIMNPAQSLRDE
jgi:putative ABC transport system permease protein